MPPCWVTQGSFLPSFNTVALVIVRNVEEPISQPSVLRAGFEEVEMTLSEMDEKVTSELEPVVEIKTFGALVNLRFFTVTAVEPVI